ncbi:MAG: metallophosphoesterase [Nanoarchaeota archaeon]|nr:metallophosphoesterase [Nanoarchaeota archaeon]MBU1945520.1 metallophosphoesterase [Nanoarchaeota archaeon]
MKFTHLADCHIGGWREPKLKNIAAEAFERAIDISIEKNVDFVLIAGDLFNTSLPSIDGLKLVVKRLKGLSDRGIPVYMIAGSHDFSPSGKTMLDVLEQAGLVVNVAKGEDVDGKLRLKFTVDKKTGVKITGMLGKKGGLEKGYYEELLKEELEKEEGYKIFLFHSLLSELKPKELEKVDSQPLSLLPKNFNYYAGGHPHIVKDVKIEGYGRIAYPGPLFPNNFRELELLGNGGFYIIEGDNVKFEPIMIYNTVHIKVDADGKTPDKVTNELIEQIKGKEFNNTIVTIRVEGVLESGRPSDIDFKGVFEKLYEKSAYFVMKNTNALVAKEFEEIKIDAHNVEDVEEKLISEHLGQIKIDNMDNEKEKALTRELMNVLSIERGDMKVADFEKRIKEEVEKVIGI